MEKENKNTEITRKEAIKKMGKYAAFTAIGTFAVLNPLRAQETSTPLGPESSVDSSNDENIETNDVPVESYTNPVDTQVGTTQVKSNF